MTMNSAALAERIDHTLLKADATPGGIDRLCDQAVRWGFGAVCVNPCYVRRAAQRLDGLGGESPSGRRVKVVSVAGFPLGANLTSIKVDEARRALDEGAAEIDMVVALGALLAGDRLIVRQDIESVARAVHRMPGGVLKVILETAVLTTEQIILGCRCCAEGEADFVKTSTGFHPAGGATVEHVRLLKRTASPIRVKAAGGIRTASHALAMVEAGADRLGTSAGVAILRELQEATR